MRNIFLKIDAENVAGKLVSGLFLFFIKTLYKVKASGHHTSVFHPYLCVSIHPCMHLCYVCILCMYTVHYLGIMLCCMPMHTCFVHILYMYLGIKLWVYYVCILYICICYLWYVFCSPVVNLIESRHQVSDS